MKIRNRRKSNTGFYHVMARGINKEQIFDQQREKGYLKKAILEFLDKYEVEIYAYCIMSNHVHLLIRADAIEQLSLFMARILARYAKYYNFKHNRNGHVFQNRFASEVIESESYFWNCLRYIHLNPVKAMMVDTALKYKFSSIREYYEDEANVVCEQAFYMYKERFQNYDIFEGFHTKRQQTIFADMPETMEEQIIEVAQMLAEEMFVEKKLTVLQQVFEEPIIREAYILKIHENLKVSKRRAKEICITVKNKIENE